MGYLKITYNNYENMVKDLDNYKKALSEMRTSLNKIDKVLKLEKGKTIESIKAIKTEIENDISEYEIQMDLLQSNINGYLIKMQKNVNADNKAKQMLVNGNDINKRIANIKRYIDMFNTNDYYYTTSFNNVVSVDEETAQKYNRNKVVLGNRYQRFSDIKKVIEEEFKTIEGIRKDKIENAFKNDEILAVRIKKEIFNVYATNQEKGENKYSKIKKGANNIFDGFLAPLVDIKDLGGAIISYGSDALISKSPLASSEKHKKSLAEKNEYLKQITNLALTDTNEFVYQLFQKSFTDDLNTKGGNYTTANIVSNILLTKAVGKLAVLGKSKLPTNSASAFGKISTIDALRYSKFWRKAPKFIPERVVLKNGGIAYKSKFGELVRSPKYLDEIGEIKWPPHNGFELDDFNNPMLSKIELKKGLVIDRYGNPSGTFTSPVVNGKALDYNTRGMPYPKETLEYHQYKVMKDITPENIKKGFNNLSPKDAKRLEKAMLDYELTFNKMADISSGNISKVFNSGGGVQIKLGTSVEWYEKLGILKEIK